MQTIKAQNVYSFILTEGEWYLATEQERQAWINQCQRESEATECKYASIMVEPDAVMSVSPIARRHTVWRYAAPSNDEEDFAAQLLAVIELHRTFITALRMRAIAKKVFGE